MEAIHASTKGVCQCSKIDDLHTHVLHMAVISVQLQWSFHQLRQPLDCFFQLLLLVLKQVLVNYILLHWNIILKKLIPKHKISKPKRIWESPSCPEESLQAVCKPAVVFDLALTGLQFSNLLLNRLSLPLLKLQGVHVPFPAWMIMDVTFQVSLCSCSFLLLLFLETSTAVTLNTIPIVFPTCRWSTEPTATTQAMMRNSEMYQQSIRADLVHTINPTLQRQL